MNRRQRSRFSQAAEAQSLDDLEFIDEEGRLRPMCLICHTYVQPGETVLQLRRLEVSVGSKSGCTNYEEVFFPDGDEEKVMHEACFASELGMLLSHLSDPPCEN